MALSNTGLLVRYWIDEAASGNGTGTVEDSSGNNFDLTLNNGASSELQYVENGGNRGLDSSATTGTQRAAKDVSNTSDIIRDTLPTLTQWTMEIVAEVDAAGFSGSTSRLFAINDKAGGNPEIGFVGFDITGTNDLRFMYEKTLMRQDVTLTAATRYVLHAVVDTTLSGNAKIKIYRDGTDTSATPTTNPGDSDGLTISSNVELIMFNRYNGSSYDRSFKGVLYYAAIYSGAFDQTRVTAHYNALTADDDTQTIGSTPKGRMMLLGVG